MTFWRSFKIIGNRY